MSEPAWPPAPLLDRWYVAIGSSALRRGAARGVTVLDRPVLVWRGDDGVARAYDDRCPHRGAPLSEGRVRSGTIECPYHGWRFEPGGACARVPSLRPDQPLPRAGLSPRPVEERDGRVLVWAGEGAPTHLAPGVDGFTAHRWVQGSAILECAAAVAIENFLDTSHTAFLHRLTHPEYFWRRLRGLRDKSYELRPTDEGFVSFAPPTASADDPIPARPAGIAELRPPYSASLAFDLLGRRHRGVFEYVPVGPHRTRVEWMRTRWLPGGPRLSPGGTNLVVAQDARILAHIGRVHRREGRAFERSVEADAVAIWARRHAEALESGRAASHPARRVVRFRG